MAQQPNRALYGAQRFVRVARSLVDPQPRVNPAERLLAQSSEDSNLPSVGPNLSSDGSNLPSEDSLVLPEDSLLQDRVGLYAPRETPPHQSQDRPILTVICDMLSCSFRRLCRVACRFMGALVLVLIFFSSMSLVCSIESPLMQALSSISFPADKLRSFTGHVPPFSDIWNGSLEISRNLYLRSTHTMGDSSPPHESPPQSGISPAINAHMTISLDVDSGKALNTIPMNMSVVHEGTSPTLRPRFDADVIARLLGTPRRTPEAVLSRDTRPGTCWPMLGSAGHITLRLRSPNTDNSSSLLHSGEIATASARDKGGFCGSPFDAQPQNANLDYLLVQDWSNDGEPVATPPCAEPPNSDAVGILVAQGWSGRGGPDASPHMESAVNGAAHLLLAQAQDWLDAGTALDTQHVAPARNARMSSMVVLVVTRAC